MIAVYADSDDAVEERNEINNCKEKEFQINLHFRQLAHGGYCHIDPEDEANGRFRISYNAKNSGTAYAYASNTTINITYRMANGSVFNFTGILDQVPARGPHSSYSSNVPFTCIIPNSTFKVEEVCVDGDNRISESNDSDNCEPPCYYEPGEICRNKWFNCPLSKPDLEIVKHEESWIDRPNRTFKITYTVQNIGRENANESTTRILNTGHYCTQEVFDPVPAVALGEKYTNEIGPF
jgi:subtilase family serine protease